MSDKQSMISGLYGAVICLAVALAGTGAYAADAPGCNDPGGLKRFEGSELKFCLNKKFDEYTLPAGKYVEGIARAAKWEQKKEVQGKASYNIYAVPIGPSGAEVFRNYQMALHDKGFQEVFMGKGEDEVGHNNGVAFDDDKISGPGTALFAGSDTTARLYTGQKIDNGVETYVMLYVSEFVAGGHPDFNPAPGQVLVRLDVVQNGELKDQMISVKASDMQKAIDEAGRINLYGIQFDFNKADIKPESRPVLDEIGKLLKASPDLALKVVGHTDGVGAADFNQRLSEARAKSVVADLVQTYGIAAGRLKSEGAGMSKPIASNDSDDGRAKNRRVELIKSN